jgi:hypothetical protein
MPLGTNAGDRRRPPAPQTLGGRPLKAQSISGLPDPHPNHRHQRREEGGGRREEEGDARGEFRSRPLLPALEASSRSCRAAVRGGERRRRRGKAGPRRPRAVDLSRASWKPELLRKDADAVNPGTGAPLLPWMPSTSTTTCSAECPNSDLFCFPYLEPNRRRSASPSSPPFTAAAKTPR